MYKKNQRVLAILLLMVMLIGVIPTNVLANVNIGTNPGNPSNNKPSDNWRLPNTGQRFGVRMSIYWAPSEADMNAGNGVVQLGNAYDFKNVNIEDRYTSVAYFTGKSVMDYMGKGSVFEVRKATEGYRFISNNAISGTMPNVENASAQQWIDYFEAKDASGEPTYKIVGEIAKELGANITAADFKSGKMSTGESDKYGQYKLFWEPVLFGKYGGWTMGMSFRDLIAFEQANPNGTNSIVGGIQFHNGPHGAGNNRMSGQQPSGFVAAGNPFYLSKDDKSINMFAKAEGTGLIGTGSAAVRAAITPGAFGYNSHGVGVVTPDTPKKSEETVIASFVKVVGYKDGQFEYETVRDTMELPLEYVEGLESSKVIKVDPVIEIEGMGDALLNDVVTTRVNTKEKLQKKGSDVYNLEWETGMEPKVEKTEPIVDEPEVYGRLHGLVLHNIDAELLEDEYEAPGGLVELDEEEESLMLESMTPVQRIYYGMFRELDKMRGETTFNSMVERVTGLNEAQYTISRNGKNPKGPGTKFYKWLEEIAVGNPEIPIEVPEIPEVLEPGKAGRVIQDNEVGNILGQETIRLEPSKTGETLEDYPVVAHLRYIVLPNSKQYHVTATKLNGEIVSVEQHRELPLRMPRSGIPENIELAQLHDLDKLVKWYTISPGPKPDLVTGYPNTLPTPLSPSEGGASGTDTLTIPEMNPGDSVIVVWETEEFQEVPLSDDTVPEWRISKYKKEMDWGLQAGMTMNLIPDLGHGPTAFFPSGNYNFHRINPNEKRNDDSDTPVNKKFSDWLHSKTIARGSDTVSHNKTRVKIDVNGDLNLVKSTELDGINLAKWVSKNTNRSEYDIKTELKGTSTGSGSAVINKNATIEHSVENKDRYTHIYPVYYHVRTWWGSICRCYLQEETPTPEYQKAAREINATFERYKQVDTDGKLVTVPATKDVKNGRTVIAIQEDTPLNIYPEYPMLFQDNKGDHKIEYAVGDRARKIKPITYHTMEYDLKVTPKSTGTSVATDTRARQKAGTMGGGNAQVIHKGGGVNSNFAVTGPGGKGKLRVRTYVMDFNNAEVKTAWGNGSYNPVKINEDFLAKWTFKGQARENLVVSNPGGAGVAYTGPTKVKNDLQYTNKKQTKSEDYDLEIRAGELYKIGGKSPTDLKNGNQKDKDLYEALEAMKLVGANKDATLFATFEANSGKPLTESLYKTEAKTARNGHDKLEIGKGWYSEDTTVLKLKMIETELDIPSNMFADKLPMTIRGLETPINKAQFYSQMSKGHTKLKYEVESTDLGKGLGKVQSFFEVTSNTKLTVQGKDLNDVTTDYLVPNVSITDTMGFN